MDSAGVERGSKMFGTGLSLRGLAVHNPAAKSIPARRTRIPIARPTTAPQSVLCVVSRILLRSFLCPAWTIAGYASLLPLHTSRPISRRRAFPSGCISCSNRSVPHAIRLSSLIGATSDRDVGHPLEGRGNAIVSRLTVWSKTWRGRKLIRASDAWKLAAGWREYTGPGIGNAMKTFLERSQSVNQISLVTVVALKTHPGRQQAVNKSPKESRPCHPLAVCAGADPCSHLLASSKALITNQIQRSPGNRLIGIANASLHQGMH